jgi:hypothetical protein
MSYLKYESFLRKLRGDQRYKALLKRMNLPVDEIMGFATSRMAPTRFISSS